MKRDYCLHKVKLLMRCSGKYLFLLKNTRRISTHVGVCHLLNNVLSCHFMKKSRKKLPICHNGGIFIIEKTTIEKSKRVCFFHKRRNHQKLLLFHPKMADFKAWPRMASESLVTNCLCNCLLTLFV